MEELKDLNKPDYVSKLGSKEVSKKLCNFTLAIKKACHCEDERSEDVAIAKSLNINEITTQSSIARNDKSSSETNLTTYRLNDLTSFLDTVFSRFTSHFSRKRVAFTLAEVLITLGIIGVVSALTLPSVVAKFQQKSFSTAFKKEYSTLNNAINMVVYEQDTRDCYQSIKYVDGIVAYDEVVTDCTPLKKGLISKLNLTPVKKDFVYTKSQDVKNNGGVSSNFGVIYEYWLNTMSAFMLKDGAIVLFYYNEQNPSAGGYANVAFVVDVNGKKGPNRWGYDVFWLTLVKTSDNGLRLTDEYSSLSEKGGSLPRNILLNNWSNDYNKKVHHGVWK